MDVTHFTHIFRRIVLTKVYCDSYIKRSKNISNNDWQRILLGCVRILSLDKRMPKNVLKLEVSYGDDEKNKKYQNSLRPLCSVVIKKFLFCRASVNVLETFLYVYYPHI